MSPKLSIAVHSGVFEYWPQLQNLLKSFVACNEYPNVEIILVESGGNKKIRDWFEEINFNNIKLISNNANESLLTAEIVSCNGVLSLTIFSSVAGDIISSNLAFFPKFL